jgi:hypothetical protein
MPVDPVKPVKPVDLVGPRIKYVYRSLWLRGLVICIFFVGNLTWNEVGRTFGLDWFARLLLQRGIPISLTVALLVWAISLLPWMFYRGANSFHNAQVSSITGICCTLLLYAILAWHSFSLIPGVSPPLITLSLFLSFFQRMDICLISLIQSKKNFSVSTSEPFSIFFTRITDLLFFPSFAWLVRDTLVLSFYLFFLLLASYIGLKIIGPIYLLFNPPSRSSNRKSDELRSYGKNEFRTSFDARVEAEAEKAREEFYRGRNDEDA